LGQTRFFCCGLSSRNLKINFCAELGLLSGGGKLVEDSVFRLVRIGFTGNACLAASSDFPTSEGISTIAGS